MTARVKELTNRAMRSAAKAPPPATQPVSDLRAFLEAFGRLGYDVKDLRQAAGLSAEQLSDLDAFVPTSATSALFGRALAVRPLKNLALRLALETPFGAFPLLDHLVATCQTVGDALKRLAQYFRLVCAPIEIEIREDEDPIRIVYHQTCVGPSFSIEYATCLALEHIRREADGRVGVVSASFVHALEDLADFEKRLRCPVSAPGDWNGFALTRASWKVPLRRRDASLHGLLESQADAAGSRQPWSGSASDELRHALALRLAQGDAQVQSIEALARHLAMSTRTLQRRLADEGSSYQEILAETRREAAERFLGESALSVAEVGYLLGYSEPAAFHRAFRRWHRVTPVEFRRMRRAKPQRRSGSRAGSRRGARRVPR
jgi:AraC-like DNA-binding protein